MKKVLAIVVALAMVMALAVPAFALEGSQDLVLVTQEQGSWQSFVSDRVTVNAAGEYTFTLSGMSFDGANMTVLYIKDADAVEVEQGGGTYEGTNNLTGATILTKSVKINGEEVALTEGYRTGTADSGLIDICWFNIWDTSFMDAPSGTVTDIEVTVEVVDADAAAAEEPAAEEPAAEEPAAEEPAAEEPEAPAADDASAPVEDGTAADNNTVAPSTGLVFAVIPAVVALAAVAVSKKH